MSNPKIVGKRVVRREHVIARANLVRRQLEATPDGPMSTDELLYLNSLDDCIARFDKGEFDVARQCPECAMDALDWVEVDVGVGVLHGPAHCMSCGWSAAEE